MDYAQKTENTNSLMDRLKFVEVPTNDNTNTTSRPPLSTIDDQGEKKKTGKRTQTKKEAKKRAQSEADAAGEPPNLP